MGINLAGAAAGYLGYQDNERRLADDARRAKEAERADEAAAFAEETRKRQRTEWKEVDNEKEAEKRDQVELLNQLQGGAVGSAPPAEVAPPAPAAPVEPAATPASDVGVGAPTAAAAPTPSKPSFASAGGTSNRPGDFSQALALRIALTQRKAARGKVSLEELANMRGLQTRIENEGVQQALSLMAQGRYDDAMAHYNSVGAMKGARIVEGAEGVTKINGEERPTHFVTIRNADGTFTKLDVTKNRHQLLEYDKQVEIAQRADQLRDQREHHKGVREDNKAQRDQQAKDAEAGRALQRAHLRQAQQHYDAGTPMGQIQAKEKALGRVMSTDEKATMLGVDNMAPAVRLQVNSLLKEQDQIAQSMSKAMAEGSWAPNSEGAKALTERSAALNLRMGSLLGGNGGAARTDPFGLKGAPAPAATAPNPVGNGRPQPVTPLHVPAVVVPRTGGVAAAQAGVAAAPERINPVAQAMGLSAGNANNAMNAIVLEKAAGIQAAATAVKQASQVYAAVANSGDKAALETYGKQLQQARDKFNALVSATGNREDAVRAAVQL